MPGPVSVFPTHETSKVFATTLTESKAKGIAAIRISKVNGDISIEQLNANQNTIIGFNLHALLNSARQISAIAVTQMGSGPSVLPLTPVQRLAFGEITDELKQIKTLTFGAQPTESILGHGVQVRVDWRHWLEEVDVGLACGAAIVEAGVNPLADAGCVVAATLANMNNGQTDTPDPPTNDPTTDVPDDPTIDPPTSSPIDTPTPDPSPSGPVSFPGDGLDDPSGGGGGVSPIDPGGDLKHEED